MALLRQSAAPARGPLYFRKPLLAIPAIGKLLVPRDRIAPALTVEPDVLHAPAVVLAVDHDGQAFELLLHAGGGTGVVNDRAGAVLL